MADTVAQGITRRCCNIDSRRPGSDATESHPADTARLQASGYDFQTRDNQQVGITLLSAFNTLPEAVLKDNLATVTAINHDADVNTCRRALADAESVGYLYFLSDAMGPRLGRAFLTAYDKGELGKAAALIKASEVSTSAAKDIFIIRVLSRYRVILSIWRQTMRW